MIISYVQVRYEVDMKCFLPKWAVQHLAKVTWMKVIENPFMIKVSRWLISSCLYFTDAGWGIWCFPKKMFPQCFGKWTLHICFQLWAESLCDHYGWVSNIHTLWVEIQMCPKYWNHSRGVDFSHDMDQSQTQVTNLRTLTLTSDFNTNDYWLYTLAIGMT